MVKETWLLQDPNPELLFHVWTFHLQAPEESVVEGVTEQLPMPDPQPAEEEVYH